MAVNKSRFDMFYTVGEIKQMEKMQQYTNNQ